MTDIHEQMIAEYGEAMKELTLASQRREPDLAPYADRVTSAHRALLERLSAKPREEIIPDEAETIDAWICYLGGLADGVEQQQPTTALHVRNAAQDIEKATRSLFARAHVASQRENEMRMERDWARTRWTELKRLERKRAAARIAENR